jgi:hypothetical protein
MYGRVLLKGVLKKYLLRKWTGFSWLMVSTVAVSVNMVMDLCVSYVAGNLLTGKKNTLSSKRNPFRGVHYLY